MSSSDPKTTSTGAGTEAADDVQSDPAKGADDRTDWSDEGGATPQGPAEDD